MIKRTESGGLYERGHANLKLPKTFGAVSPLQKEKTNKQKSQKTKKPKPTPPLPPNQTTNLKPQESLKYSSPYTPCWNFAFLNSELGLAGCSCMHLN